MRIYNIYIVGHYTFKEIFKSKILFNVFLIGLALMGLSYIATEFTYGVPQRVALDFGLGMLSLSSMAISLFLGVGLLSKEIDSRTVYMIISRPVPRFAFILGKILGLLGILALNVFLLSAMTLISVSILSGELSELIFWAIGFIFLESVLLLLVVVFISLVTNNTLAVLLSLAILVLGHGVKEAQNLSFTMNSPALKSVLKAYHFALPGFYKLNLKDFILYKQTLPLSYLLNSLSYGIIYCSFLLLLIIYTFNKKSID